MQLTRSFSALLTGAILTISTHGAWALPAKRSAGMITIPLQPVQPSGMDVHPEVFLQQHMNRGLRRLARMTGRSAPSDEELRSNIDKRVLSIEGPDSLSKRFYPVHIPFDDAGVEIQAVDDTGSPLAATLTAPDAGTRSLSLSPAATPCADAKASPSAASSAAAPPGNATANNVTPANQPSIANSLGLSIDANDVGYLGTIQIGTPPKDFLLLMDSGSADLWVGGETCKAAPTGGDCGQHHFLGSQSSTSFKDTAQPWNITYGQGNVAGTIVTDDVAFAGLTLTDHTFGIATTESPDFSRDGVPFDGIMGLAKSTLSRQRALTPIEALVEHGLVKEPIMSYKLSRLADKKNDGEVTFGGLDSAKFDAATLVALPNINSEGFWETNLGAVTVDGADLGITGRTAILDTGTTIIIAPVEDAVAIHKKIQGAKMDNSGGFTIPCDTSANVTLVFGKTQFAIDPRDLAFQPLDPNNLKGDCLSGISGASTSGPSEWLVGDTFLKNAYFSTDVAKNTLSLAKLV